MPITIGLDAGTTTITALALDAVRGEVMASATLANDLDVTAPPDAARGRSEWDAEGILRRAAEAIREVAGRLGARRGEVAGIGLTGQQHGVVLVDERLRPATPFIGWRDRRGLEAAPKDGRSYVAWAEELTGPGASSRRGCALAAGFMGVTLFWMKAAGVLPAKAAACFLTDYLGASLTGTTPRSDPTMGGSGGLLDLAQRRWDLDAIRCLELPPALFPDLGEAGDLLGGLTVEAARLTGLPAGLPVFVGLGDNQASFLGSVADRGDTVQVNVGTGGQVGRYTEKIHHAPPLETRPFPRGGYLLVEAGLCGGRAYATLRQFFRAVAVDLLDVKGEAELYAAMNRLAVGAARGAGGLRCEPFFTGSRADPGRRANWTDVSEENFTPANMVRSLLEGMARAFSDGYGRIRAATGSACTRLVGAGNGVRENAVLRGIIAEEFGMPLAVPAHREEAAMGAALTAAVGAGILPDLTAAGKLIRYQLP